MRVFRVTTNLQPYMGECFTVGNGMLRRHAGPRFTSLRAAQQEAARAASNGWFAAVWRRVPGGWVEVEAFDADPSDY